MGCGIRIAIVVVMMKSPLSKMKGPPEGVPGRLLGCLGLGFAGRGLADDDLRAVERQVIELEAEALAVAVRPGGADFAPVIPLAVLGYGVDPVAGEFGCVAHGDVLSFRFEAMHLARLRGALCPARTSGAFTGCRR